MNQLKKDIKVGEVNFLIILIYIFLSGFIVPAVTSENLEGEFIDIKILDKVSSKSSLLKLKIGE